MSAIFAGISWIRRLVPVRYLAAGLYTVNQNERAVKTSFGRAERVGDATTLQDPIAASLSAEEKERYNYPQVRVIPPGGPYFKWPWERVYKVSVATQTMNMAMIPKIPSANYHGTMLEAVTKDQLNTGLKGQIRWRVFGAKSLRLSLRRETSDHSRHGLLCFGAARTHRQFRSASPPPTAMTATMSPPPPSPAFRSTTCGKICATSTTTWTTNAPVPPARYGIVLRASLITGIDPPPDVESALAAINTAYNEVPPTSAWRRRRRTKKSCSPGAPWKSKRSRRRPRCSRSLPWPNSWVTLKKSGAGALDAYVRNVRLQVL